MDKLGVVFRLPINKTLRLLPIQLIISTSYLKTVVQNKTKCSQFFFKYFKETLMEYIKIFKLNDRF